MKKFVYGILISISLTSLPVFSATPPKSGSACSKQGITQNYLGKKFTCIKSGKKLVWNSGVLIEKSSQAQSSPTSSQPQNNSSISSE